MRYLPTKRTERQNIIIKATEDFFGQTDAEEKKSITRIALWIMGRKAKNEINEKEKEIMKLIHANLEDETYRGNLRLESVF